MHAIHCIAIHSMDDDNDDEVGDAFRYSAMKDIT